MLGKRQQHHAVSAIIKANTECSVGSKEKGAWLCLEWQEKVES